MLIFKVFRQPYRNFTKEASSSLSTLKEKSKLTDSYFKFWRSRPLFSSSLSLSHTHAYTLSHTMSFTNLGKLNLLRFGPILSSGQFFLQLQQPLKTKLAIKVVKIDSKIIIVLLWSKSIKQTASTQILVASLSRTISNTFSMTNTYTYCKAQAFTHKNTISYSQLHKYVPTQISCSLFLLHKYNNEHTHTGTDTHTHTSKQILYKISQTLTTNICT